MIAITLQEKEQIVKQYPHVKMVRTMVKDSKRHHYYMVEERGPMGLLNKLRGEDVPHKRKRRW